MGLILNMLGAFLILIRTLFEGLFHAVDVVWVGRGLLQDRRAAQASLEGGFHCPLSHPIATHGLFTCEACGFTYEGSIFQCSNKECRAVTPHISCPTCSRSVRNPYRYGRP